MGGEQAAAVLATVRRDGVEAAGQQWSAAEEEAVKAPIRDKYEVEGSPGTPRRACGTTGSSTPPTPVASSALVWPPPRTPRCRRPPTASSGCEGAVSQLHSRPFASVLVANRGEIAVRVLRAARAAGLRTVAVFSDADARSAHLAEADAAVRIGPTPAASSYLSIPALLRACADTGAEAVHPGYGFLSEQADFARAVTDAGPGLGWDRRRTSSS
jgi:hypothetical protein